MSTYYRPIYTGHVTAAIRAKPGIRSPASLHPPSGLTLHRRAVVTIKKGILLLCELLQRTPGFIGTALATGVRGSEPSPPQPHRERPPIIVQIRQIFIGNGVVVRLLEERAIDGLRILNSSEIL